MAAISSTARRDATVNFGGGALTRRLPQNEARGRRDHVGYLHLHGYISELLMRPHHHSDHASATEVDLVRAAAGRAR